MPALNTALTTLGEAKTSQDPPKPRSKFFKLRSMLAHFSLWGAFFSLLAGSQTLLALFWLMLVVFFGLGVAAGSILGGLGRVLEPSNKHFSMIFGVNTHASQKYSSCNKTTVFAMFCRVRNMPHMATKHVSCIAFKAFLDMVQ